MIPMDDYRTIEKAFDLFFNGRQSESDAAMLLTAVMQFPERAIIDCDWLRLAAIVTVGRDTIRRAKHKFPQTYRHPRLREATAHGCAGEAAALYMNYQDNLRAFEAGERLTKPERITWTVEEIEQLRADVVAEARAMETVDLSVKAT